MPGVGYRRDICSWGTRFVGAVAALLLAGLAVAASPAPAGRHREQWFQVGTAHGNVEGYRWSAGAKGLKGKPLGKICAELSIVEPPREGVPYVEGRDASDCGELSSMNDLVVTSVMYGSGDLRVSVLQALYRPRVRKVRVVLGSGRRMSLRAQYVPASSSPQGGVPSFRYVIVPLKAGEPCIRQVIAFDGRGRIASKRSLPPCA